MAVFAVTMVYGPGWDAGRPRREQPGWDRARGVHGRPGRRRLRLLGGPIGDGEDVLLAVEAADEAEIADRLRRRPLDADRAATVDR